MLTSKCKWKNLSLGLIFVSSFLISGCPAVETRAPLLTEKNAEVVENIEGYFYAFYPDRKNEDDFVGFIEIFGTDKKNNYKYSSLFESGLHILRFIKLGENWFLVQSKVKDVNNMGIFLWFVEREGKQASVYVKKKDYSLNLEGFPNLVGHVTMEGPKLEIDKTAANTLGEEVIQFLKKEFIDHKINLDHFLELGPSDERTVYKYWCQQAVKKIYLIRNPKSAREAANLKFRIDYSVKTCKRAVALSPDSVELKRSYGKALQKAKHFSEALEGPNKY